MEVRVKVDTLNKNTILERKQYIEFETYEINDYKKMFQQLVDGYHISGAFDDVNWELSSKLLDYPVIICFDIEFYYKLNTALKVYTILRLLSGRAALTIYNDIAILKKAIVDSKGLSDLNKFGSMLEVQSNIFSHQGFRIATTVKKFLSFYKVKNHKKIIEICNSIPSYKQTSRELPLFEDIMIFDDIVNDYFKKFPPDQTIEFLPIMVWWLLTTVIPMRPSEFLLIQKDCLEIKDGYRSPYRITVPRIKNESDSPDFVIRYDSLEIDSDTYNLINKSIKQIESLGTDSPFLFPVELLTIFRKHKVKKKNRRINRRDFDLLKKKFYEKIVEGIYGKYDLEKIKSGDTRHFAIINMCLQGFNMLSIARMAGHKEIDTQFSYYSHAEHFAQSSVYRIAQRKLESKISSNIAGGIIGWKRYIYDKGKSRTINNKEDIVGRVQYGDCTEHKDIFPNNCIESCEFCSKYIFNPYINENEEALNWLTDSSRTLEIKIRESIEVMKGVSTNLSNSLKSSNNDILKSTSRNLITYMDMKATVDANLLEVKAFEKEN